MVRAMVVQQVCVRSDSPRNFCRGFKRIRQVVPTSSPAASGAGGLGRPHRFFDLSGMVGLACLALLVLLSGCGPGNSSPVDHQQPADPQQIPAKPAATVSPADGPTTPPGDSPNDENADLQDSPKAPRLAAGSPNAAGDVPVGPQVDPPAVASDSEVRPTADQLARWDSPPRPRWVLLSVRLVPDMGLLGEISSLNDGQSFVIGGSAVTLHSLASQQAAHVLAMPNAERLFTSIEVAPNGEWIAAGDDQGSLHVWNTADRSLRFDKKIYPGSIADITISPNSKLLASLDFNGEVSVWRADDLQLLSQLRPSVTGLRKIEFVNEDELIAAGETTELWNIATAKSVRQFSATRYHFAVQRARDGSAYVLGTQNGLLVCGGAAGQETVVPGGFASEELIAWANDNQGLATANANALRVWDLAGGDLVQVIDSYGGISGIDWLPGSNLLVVGSMDGTVRVWGSVVDGNSHGLTPIQPEVSPKIPAGHQPATAHQLKEMLDLRTFARLPGAIPQISDASQVSFLANVPVLEAQQFYEYQFGKAGWVRNTAGDVPPNATLFEKSGFWVNVDVRAESQATTAININHAGNLDVRWLPKINDQGARVEAGAALPAASLVFENRDTVLYRSQASMPRAEVGLLRALQQDGWTGFARLNSSQSEQADRRQLEFLQGGYYLSVSLSRGADAAGPLTIQYTRSLNFNTMPIPADCGFVEFDGSVRPNLVASTALDLAATQSFYDQNLAAEGWVAQQGFPVRHDDRLLLRYLFGQQDLTIRLVKLPNGRTQILVGEELERASWQLAAAQPAAAQDSTLQPAAKTGIEAADFPLLNATKTAKYDVTSKSIEISMGAAPLIEVGKLYATELSRLGWQQAGDGISAEDYVFRTFSQAGEELELRARAVSGEAIVNVQGDGLKWLKSLPGSQQVVSYAAWLRQGGHPATLDLLDEYLNEMQAMQPAR